MTVHNDDAASPGDQIADADLVLRTRSGDAQAFGELWRRHYRAGITVARSVTSSIEADDLVQESYTRVYQAIAKGGGPTASFRAYLFTSIRNTAAAWGAARRESAIDELDAVADPGSTEQAANEALDRGLTAQAFRSLPSRWQEVLWYTEIERMKPQEVAPLLGMKAGAVSQLAFRAREGLREAWIQAHLRSAAADSDCQWTIEHLGAYSRGNLGIRDVGRLEQHLDQCARCMIVAAEAKDVSQRLALVLLPLVLGTAGAAGYLAALQGGGVPLVALAAMPGGVTGSVVGGSTGATAGSGSAGASAGSASASVAGTSAGASAAGGGSAAVVGTAAIVGAAAGGPGIAAGGGILTGLGALVGTGSAVLVVAGVVTAASIVPGLTGATVPASLPGASESGPSSIAAVVGPDEAMSNDRPFVIQTGPPAEGTPEPPSGREKARKDAAKGPSIPETGPAAAPPLGQILHRVEILDPEVPIEVPADPVDTDPEGPTLPEGAPAWTRGEPWCEPQPEALFDITHLTLVVSGSPGASVRAEILSLFTSGNGGQVVLDGSGNGTIDLRPSVDQLLLPSTVHVRYVLGELAGPAEPFSLRELYDDLDCVLPQTDEETPVDDSGSELESATLPQAETFSVETSAAQDTAPEPTVAPPAPSATDAADEPEAPSPPLPAESLPAEAALAPSLEAPAPEGELAPAEAAAPAE